MSEWELSWISFHSDSLEKECVCTWGHVCATSSDDVLTFVVLLCTGQDLRGQPFLPSLPDQRVCHRGRGLHSVGHPGCLHIPVREDDPQENGNREVWINYHGFGLAGLGSG